jgi:hypothetical protein
MPRKHTAHAAQMKVENDERFFKLVDALVADTQFCTEVLSPQSSKTRLQTINSLIIKHAATVMFDLPIPTNMAISTLESVQSTYQLPQTIPLSDSCKHYLFNLVPISKHIIQISCILLTNWVCISTTNCSIFPSISLNGAQMTMFILHLSISFTNDQTYHYHHHHPSSIAHAVHARNFTYSMNQSSLSHYTKTILDYLSMQILGKSLLFISTTLLKGNQLRSWTGVLL